MINYLISDQKLWDFLKSYEWAVWWKIKFSKKNRIFQEEWKTKEILWFEITNKHFL
jgi:hypothetical protein